jgi:hypothetical protein
MQTWSDTFPFVPVVTAATDRDSVVPLVNAIPMWGLSTPGNYSYFRCGMIHHECGDLRDTACFLPYSLYLDASLTLYSVSLSQHLRA